MNRTNRGKVTTTLHNIYYRHKPAQTRKGQNSTMSTADNQVPGWNLLCTGACPPPLRRGERNQCVEANRCLGASQAVFITRRSEA